MKKYIILLPAILFSTGAFAQKTITVNTSLEHVTIYSPGAEMQHRAAVTLPAGNNEIIFKNVANVVDEKSICITAPAHLTIMSVAFRKDYVTNDSANKSPQYLKIQNEIKATQAKVDSINNEITVENSTLDLLEDNKSTGTETSGVNVETLMKLADFYKKKQLEIRQALTGLRNQLAAQQEKINRLNNQLLEINSNNAYNGGEIIVQADANSPINNANISISYITPNAGWTAFYDLRAESITSPLQIIYKANVVQNTGINWKKVKLTLSTGNPSQNNTMPTLSTWFLKYCAPPVYADKYKGTADAITADQLEKYPVTSYSRAIEGAAPGIQSSNSGQPGSAENYRIRGVGSVSASGSPLIVIDGTPYNGSLSDINPDDIASVKTLKDAEATSLYGSRGANGVVVVTSKGHGVDNYTSVINNQLTAVFDIDIAYDIASDSKPHNVEVKQYKQPVVFKYYAIPRLDLDAFLVAEVPAYEKLNLIPGDANIIFENMYVGKSAINPYATNDTLQLSMGRDKNIVIRREKITDATGTKFIGNNKKQTYTYDINIKNNKSAPVLLTVMDQYPVATSSDMEVELLQSDDADVNKETGALKWDLKLAPGASKTVRLSYSVKYPKSRLLANL